MWFKEKYIYIHKMTEIYKCSRCKCQKLAEFYSIKKNTGKRYKTCKKCMVRFKCEECDYKCSSKCELNVHIKKVHDKIKDHECKECDSKFSTGGDLNQHIKAVHNKIKDHECKKCDYKCSSGYDLNKHIKTCTGKRNISSGELMVINALKDLGFDENDEYNHDTSFSELTDWCNKSLRFDFRFLEHKTIIEYDGIQHFKPQRFGGMSQEKAEACFEQTKLNDKLKDDFCNEFGYKMIRISYKDFDKVLSILSEELFDIVDWCG